MIYDDTYFDFISAIVHYAEKKESRKRKLIQLIKNNPNITSSDVIRFVSEQKDFFEDAAYMKAVYNYNGYNLLLM